MNVDYTDCCAFPKDNGLPRYPGRVRDAYPSRQRLQKDIPPCRRIAGGIWRQNQGFRLSKNALMAAALHLVQPVPTAPSVREVPVNPNS
jgi:hypothetical protein